MKWTLLAIIFLSGCTIWVNPNPPDMSPYLKISEANKAFSQLAVEIEKLQVDAKKK